MANNIKGLTGGQEESLEYWLRRMRDQENQATAWGEGNRGMLEGQYSDLWNNPGYNAEEMGLIGVSPEEEAGIIHSAGRPIAGAAFRAQDELKRGAAARGGYAPGLNASVQRIQQEQGRQGAEAVLQAKLGVNDLRRRGAMAIGDARMQGRQFATHGRLGLQGLDQNRMLGYANLGANVAT